MRFNVGIVAVGLITGCASLLAPQLDAKEAEAVRLAEQFIARHGYTAAGHPSDLPVEDVEVLDAIATPEQLIEWRNGTLVSTAFGVTTTNSDGYYYVFFNRAKSDGFRAVLVQGSEAQQVVHSVLRLEGFKWKKVPPNNALERSARGLAWGAAGAPEMLAPAAPSERLARPAQRGRWATTTHQG